ncbi:MAG: DUF58 domain-containing protein [Cyanobacteria bacterium P01_H01_bin.15]
MMLISKLFRDWESWLEIHWFRPTYSGTLLFGLSLCFFGAAANTLAGWLYVLCGTIIALLMVGIWLPGRALRALAITKQPLAPISVGDRLVIQLAVVNSSPYPIGLFELCELVPTELGVSKKVSVEYLPPQSNVNLELDYLATSRGIYRWSQCSVRTGAPLGVVWCQRLYESKCRAVIYPRVLPLKHCPLLDSMGQSNQHRLECDRIYKNAGDGLTRTLREYRRGDPFRLIHWRNSARLGELQVRELEQIVNGPEVIIALDSSANWNSDAFERAVIVAASLYFYCVRSQFTVQLWTPGTGLIQGNSAVLEVLAGAGFGETLQFECPNQPLIWLTQNPHSPGKIPVGSRWCYFPEQDNISMVESLDPGLVMTPNQPLEQLLQQHLP